MNVVWQGNGEPLSPLFRNAGATRTFRLRHLVNLYRNDGSDGLNAVQQATVASMRRAQAHTYATGTSTNVELAAVVSAEDVAIVPEGFIALPSLSRTVLDVQDPPGDLAFPLLFDIIETGRLGGDEQDDGSFTVFTNSDICLQPTFYDFVAAALSSGFDALVVNRRTLPIQALDRDPAFAAAEIGETHPGLDCFVFPSSWINTFSRNDACVGAGFVMRGLLHNLVAHADNLLVLTEANLTYHFGDDRPWADTSRSKYLRYNRTQEQKTYDVLVESANAAARLNSFHAEHPKYIPPGVRDEVERPPSSAVAPGFSSERYRTINAARLEHLATVPIDFEGKTLLELGSGPGDLTGFFVDRGCHVTSIDARPENVEALCARHPSAEGLVLDLDQGLEPLERTFDIVFAYGLLYHVGRPAELLEWAASHCAEMLLLSTVVDPRSGRHLTITSENAATGTQSATGGACEATRAWIAAELRLHFAHVGSPKTTPLHPEFPLDWAAAPTKESKQMNGLSRCIFIASRYPIDHLDLHESFD